MAEEPPATIMIWPSLGRIHVEEDDKRSKTGYYGFQTHDNEWQTARGDGA
jgi:hypothetical protein